MRYSPTRLRQHLDEIVSILTLLALLLLTEPAHARDHYVASRVNGEIATGKADGNRGSPWPTVATALKSGLLSGGDRIILLDGTHGALYLDGYSFDPPLIIEAETPQRAHFQRISVGRAHGVTFRNLQVWPLNPPDKPRALVTSSAAASDIRFEHLDIRGRGDAVQSYMDWSISDWLTDWRSSGVELRGTGDVLLDSRLTGVAFAITLAGDHTEALGNHVLGFSGDGIRILGQGSAAIGNRIENCFKVNANHDDGIQSWAPKNQPAATRSLADLRIEANSIVEWTGPAKHPLRCSLQGIGMFDGTFLHPTIRNNLVLVSHYHGISLYGAIGGEIVNNTVANIDLKPESYPWIRLADHKDGRPIIGVIVENNVAAGLSSKPASQMTISPAKNAVVRYPTKVFLDPAQGDYRPKPDSGLIDQADPRFAPPTDLTGRTRPLGPAPDLGAFEVQ